MGHDLSLALRVSDLCHTYPDGRTALAGVGFEVRAGERIALVGPNGAGKTTLFLRLCGVLPGKRGQAVVAGFDPADPTHRKKLPGVVGVVFQNPDDQLFSATVLEDVAFGPLNLGVAAAEAREQASAALARVGLPAAGDRAPYRLSGGEKRRAALAGVLAMEPQVMLLDEPSMFLDPRGRRELIGLLTALPGTMIIATHDLDLVLETCPRVIVLDGGRVAADGPTADLLFDPELMARHGLEICKGVKK
ncbi:energy-coupling factor ABC transporter ATP-binding protein [Fimbriiglobus ruber]|uniref:ATPase component NikO of energizing module of nickel ECF transporter n=1 Tax=Fimbriiglobus ruber TaxID=1908690 RepID=A0A225D7M8_9BACT|nr:ABC transporter ATP-binding protein [Fimbriiglobus ruber]OWK36973.1 ATPase component NikO of energizing module of nickel ECF transporter [Fimbriiglobus ruber]